MISIKRGFLDNPFVDLDAAFQECGEAVQLIIDILQHPGTLEIHLGDSSAMNVMATFGKVHIIYRWIEKLSSRIPHNRYHEFEILQRDFEHTKTLHSQEFQVLASYDLREYVILGIARYYEARQILLDPSDFQHFLDRRDYIELAFLGGALEFIEEDEIEHFKRLDKSIKNYIRKTVVPRLRAGYQDILNQFKVPKIAELFWWRGL